MVIIYLATNLSIYLFHIFYYYIFRLQVQALLAINIRYDNVTLIPLVLQLGAKAD
jgi:hypothetical protein